MSFLLDTNVFLEAMLAQAQAEAVRVLLMNTGKHRFFITDFSLHSIGVILIRRRLGNHYLEFVEDLIHSDIGVFGVEKADLSDVVGAADDYELDFDDAYQYTVARRNDLSIISFDTDFDRTDRGRISPLEVR